jgi:hypothetical protein
MQPRVKYLAGSIGGLIVWALFLYALRSLHLAGAHPVTSYILLISISGVAQWGMYRTERMPDYRGRIKWRCYIFFAAVAPCLGVLVWSALSGAEVPDYTILAVVLGCVGASAAIAWLAYRIVIQWGLGAGSR